MLSTILIACSLVVITVAIHAVGFAALIRALLRSHALTKWSFWPVTGLVVVVTCSLVLIHSVEIGVWGMFYFWQGCLPDASSAVYFSAGAYTTVGAVDLVLPEGWRFLAPLEALMGNLMCGLSTGLFFAIVIRWIGNWIHERVPDANKI